MNEKKKDQENAQSKSRESGNRHPILMLCLMSRGHLRCVLKGEKDQLFPRITGIFPQLLVFGSIDKGKGHGQGVQEISTASKEYEIPTPTPAHRRLRLNRCLHRLPEK